VQQLDERLSWLLLPSILLLSATEQLNHNQRWADCSRNYLCSHEIWRAMSSLSAENERSLTGDVRSCLAACPHRKQCLLM
jgi:hypothetical protein